MNKEYLEEQAAKQAAAAAKDVSEASDELRAAQELVAAAAAAVAKSRKMEQHARQLLEPGPLDSSVLYLQSAHRSTHIWDGQNLPVLQCRRSDAALHRRQDIDPRFLRYLFRAGFYGVFRLGFIQLDWSLISALVERWRVETHTFHLPVGECSVTLQDVAILLGLPIDGAPVTGRDSIRSVVDCQALCEELLGVAPTSSDLDGSRLKIKWLAEHFSVLPDGADELTVQRHVRAYILQQIGGCLFADKSQNKVKLMFLPLLRDLHASGSISWGSAVLACLYREMCRATRHDARDIGGPLILLQLWAWERISHIRPQRLVPRERVQAAVDVPIAVDVPPADVPRAEGMQAEDQPLPDGPLGCRWRAPFSLRDTPAHVLRHYRDQLDQMRDYQMIWQPYSDDVLARLPSYCLDGQYIWKTRSPLICFEMVEWHFPDRVLRQFGLRQPIPELCDTSRELHATDRRGRTDYNWEEVHRVFVERWGERRAHIVTGDPVDGSMDYSDPYLVWYRSVTRLLVEPPCAMPHVGFVPVGGVMELLVRSMTSIYHKSEETINDIDEARRALQDIRGICSTALHVIQEHQRLTDHPLPVTPAQAPIPVPPVSKARGVVVVRPKVQRKTMGKQSRSATSALVPSTSTSIPSSPLSHQHEGLPTPPADHYNEMPTPTQTIVPVATSHTPLQDAPQPSLPEDEVLSEGLTQLEPGQPATLHTPPQDAPHPSLPEDEVLIDELTQLEPVRPATGRGRGRGKARDTGDRFVTSDIPHFLRTTQTRRPASFQPPLEGVSQTTQDPQQVARPQRPKRPWRAPGCST